MAATKKPAPIRFTHRRTGADVTDAVHRKMADVEYLLRDVGYEAFSYVVEEALARSPEALPPTTAALRFVLPYPPTGKNHLYGKAARTMTTIRDGVPVTRGYVQQFITKEAREYSQEVGAVVCNGGRPRVPAGGLFLTLELYPPDARKRDADGVIAWVQDCLALALEIDDVRIRCVTSRRRLPAPHAPRIVATLGADDLGLALGR